MCLLVVRPQPQCHHSVLKSGSVYLVLCFRVEALYFVTTTKALRRVLGKIFVMVLSCPSSE